MKPSLLIIDDDDSILQSLRGYFRNNFEVHLANGGREGISSYQKALPDAVILDLRMPDMDGLAVLQELKKTDPDVPTVMLSAYGDIEIAVHAMKLGADHFLSKPVDLQALESIINKAIRANQVQNSYKLLSDRFYELKEKLIFEPQIWEAMALMASNPDTTVLIMGPTGSGKNVLAKLIHRESSRRDGPFIDINCAGLSENLLQSELFGHERGAFTDAKTTKKGLMEIADGGTLFLDEIAEIPLSVQAQVLSAIETKSFRRIGGTSNIEVDVRIVAATNSNLPEKVKNKQFREDLYYRLNIIPITLVPLKDRKEDIPKFASLFLDEFIGRTNKNISGFTSEALLLLTNYDWPGNIRELKNIIERATLLCKGDRISPYHLPVEFQGEFPVIAQTEVASPMTLEESEKQAIKNALKFSNYNKAAAARILAVNVSTLMRKIKKYQISRD